MSSRIQSLVNWDLLAGGLFKTGNPPTKTLVARIHVGDFRSHGPKPSHLPPFLEDETVQVVPQQVSPIAKNPFQKRRKPTWNHGHGFWAFRSENITLPCER